MITAEQASSNQLEILELLKSVSRKGIDDLISFAEGSDFFSAPASTRYHGNYPGGLAYHSYLVYKGFKRQVDYYELKIPSDSIIITGICHDFCKIGLYQPNVLKDGQVPDAKPYKHVDDFPLGHGEKSLSIVQRHIQLTNQEAMIIRWHMGSYDPAWHSNQEKIEKTFPEVVVFHHADHEVSLIRGV